MTDLIEVSVNGDPRRIPSNTSIAALIAQSQLDPLRVAVEVNERLVRRAHFGETPLRAADRIEIVTLVGGG